jgi:serine/threonine-protein kinase
MTGHRPEAGDDDGTPTQAAELHGPVLGGRYEVGALIGRGGMADVRAGHDRRLGRTVAIKRLRNDLARDPIFQARFRREAQSAAGLNHPAIVAVYDTGDEIDADGSHVPFIVMEFVEGQTLRELMRDGRKILPERALELTADTLSALDYSHRAGIVHRDIKPANVMLTAAGRVKVMDFGIARAIADSSSTMTATAAVVGTAQYLSPEQARGEQVDARSDIYSTGCLLFELLTGRPPFTGDSPVAVAYQHVREAPPAPSSLEPEVTPEIDAIVAKSLAKKTSERYQSAAEMRADIERALAGEPVVAPMAAAGAVAAAATTALPGASNPTSSYRIATTDTDEEEPPTRRRLWLWLILGLLLAGLLGVVAWLLTSNSGNDDVVAVPSVVGDRIQEATSQLETAGFEVSAAREPSDEPRGQVVGQDPDGGTSLEPESIVNLVVSGGPATVQVPTGLRGSSRGEAAAALRAVDLRATFTTAPGLEPPGNVIDVDPESGTEVSPGSTVALTLSEGPVIVPSVVGETQRAAARQIQAQGLEPFVTYDPDAAAQAGIVTDQSPAPETAAQVGDQVTIVVSSAVEPTTPPPTTTEPPTTEEPTTEEPTTEEPTTEEPTTEEPTTEEPTEEPTTEDPDENPDEESEEDFDGRQS